MNKVARHCVILGFVTFTGGYLYGLGLGQPYMAVAELHPIARNNFRIEHAKELFGRHYKTSIVHRAEFVPGIDQFVLEKLQEGLPAQWQFKATDIADAVIDESSRNGMDPIFILAVLTRESRMNPDARGRHGEIGLMQLKPDTAAWIAKKSGIAWNGPTTLKDPAQNIRLGVAYMNFLRKRYDRHSLHYISAYNMGPGNLQQLLNQDRKPREYANGVMSIYTGMYSEIVRANALRTAETAQFRVANR